jgi:hypothetical protein
MERLRASLRKGAHLRAFNSSEALSRIPEAAHRLRASVMQEDARPEGRWLQLGLPFATDFAPIRRTPERINRGPLGRPECPRLHLSGTFRAWRPRGRDPDADERRLERINALEVAPVQG